MFDYSTLVNRVVFRVGRQPLILLNLKLVIDLLLKLTITILTMLNITTPEDRSVAATEIAKLIRDGGSVFIDEIVIRMQPESCDLIKEALLKHGRSVPEPTPHYRR